MKHAQKQKTLLPTLKEGQRYVVYEIKPAQNVDVLSNVGTLLAKECTSLLGVFDSAKAGLISVKYDISKRRGIIRIERKYVDKLKVLFGMITLLQEKKVNIDCLYVSGMLNKAEFMMNKA
ncbi:MAG: Rpp14/Pop5 family protein [Candidatus Woesearchaeota archaeon]